MQRPIKFRAWDGRQMLYRDLCDRNWYNTEDKLVCVALPEDAHNLIIMQYTGLKDKNGAEIYEDDIITFNNNMYPYEMLKIRVEYNGERSGFSPFCENFEYENESFFDTFGNGFEAIGNIYENPELLEAK